MLVELRQIDYQMRIEQEEHLINQQQATHELVRGLAHEIKNPLGGLRGAAQLLERKSRMMSYGNIHKLLSVRRIVCGR